MPENSLPEPLVPPALPAAPEWSEAFGEGRPPAPGYEAFGRPRHDSKRTDPLKKKRHKQEEDSDADLDDDAAAKEDDQPEEQEEDDKSDEKKKDQGKKDADKDKPTGPPIYKRPAFLIIAALVVLILIAVGIAWWLYARQFESTDDAYINSHVTIISPQVSGPVQTLAVDDNQFVHKGDLLLQIDPTNYQVALEQAAGSKASAEGRLAQAEAQIGSAAAAYEEATAAVTDAAVELDNATRDLKRYQQIDPRARSQQQLDNALTKQKGAQAQLDQAKAKQASAKADIETANAAVKAAQGSVQAAQADVHRALVNLGYCRVTAPSDGRVTQKTIEPGAYIAAGQAAFSLVSPDVWVVANFKETQLTRMHPGQHVTIEVDAYSGKTYSGHVDSIQAGSGSRFSLLPAENATGNFVKIVQRVPVKIVFDHGPNTNDARLLSPGLSVVPKVKVR